MIEPLNADFAKAMVAAQRAVKVALKDSNNPHYKSKYADLGSVWDACREALHANGIGLFQNVVVQDDRPGVITVFIHESGHQLSFGPLFMPAPLDAQKWGSAITYARRYSLSAALSMIADVDDDANAVVEPAKAAQLVAKAPAANKAPDPAAELAVSTIRGAFWPTTHDTWLKAIDGYKTAQQCKDAKDTCLAWCKGDASHEVYKRLGEKYKELVGK